MRLAACQRSPPPLGQFLPLPTAPPFHPKVIHAPEIPVTGVFFMFCELRTRSISTSYPISISYYAPISQELARSRFSPAKHASLSPGLVP